MLPKTYLGSTHGWMITDEECREVAAELRALDVSYIGVNGRIMFENCPYCWTVIDDDEH